MACQVYYVIKNRIRLRVSQSLRVGLASGASHYGGAWRMDFLRGPDIGLRIADNECAFQFLRRRACHLDQLKRRFFWIARAQKNVGVGFAELMVGAE